MSSDPYAPPGWGPPLVQPSRRGGWPTWLLTMTSLVTGLLLLAAPLLVLGHLAGEGGSRPDPASSSYGSRQPAQPPAQSDPAPHSAPTPQPTTTPEPGVGTGRERLDIIFPDGSTGSFAVPTAMQHSGGDSEGHVSMWSVVPFGTPYLDVYTERTAASRRADLAGVAAFERSYHAGRGERVSPVTFRAIGGHDVAEFTLRTKGKYADQVYDNLVTVMLVGHQVLSVYWRDHVAPYRSARAHADTASLLRSFHADSAGPST